MIVAMLRVKNEARWIGEVLEAALQVCSEAFIMDDHSTDETPEVCRSFGARAHVLSSFFDGLDETRDKNWLIDQVQLNAPGAWVLAIDGDEMLENPKAIEKTVASGHSDCYALRVLYLWNRRDRVRVDGVYGRFWRPSLFRLKYGARYRATGNGANFHCGNVPAEFGVSSRSSAKLLHFGYMDVKDRQRKFAWYNENDPNNRLEDSYRHMVQGDPGGPSAAAHLRHAGPIELVSLETIGT